MMLRTLAVFVAAVALAQGQDIMCSEPGTFDRTCMNLYLSGGDVIADAARRTSQVQVPDKNLGLGNMFPGVRVWQDLEESAWKKILEWLEGVPTIIASSSLETTKEMYWACGAVEYTGSPFCEIYAFAYECASTCDFESGDFMQLVRSEGFDPIRCGQSVYARTGGKEHQMVVFRKIIPENSDFTLTMTAAKTEFVAFALNPQPILCASFETEDLCTNTKGKCEMVDGQCVLRQCLRRQVGPGGICTNLCIDLDL